MNLLSILVLSLLFLALISYLRKKYANNDFNGIMLVLGKGGHTAEMLYLIKNYEFERFSRIYIMVAENDTLSIEKTNKFIKENKVTK